jgi:hypothetical protein
MTFLPVQPRVRPYWIALAVGFGFCTTFFVNNFLTGFLTVIIVAVVIEPIVEGDFR